MNSIIILTLLTFACMILDFLSGVIQAKKNKTLKSSILRTGLYHKIAFSLMMCLGYIMEIFIEYYTTNINIPTYNMICIYIITTEIVSINENLKKINEKANLEKVEDKNEK